MLSNNFLASDSIRKKALSRKGSLMILLTALLIASIAASPLYFQLEQRTGLTWLFGIRGPKKPPNNIAIIAIDSNASANLNLPRQIIRWPRSVYAQIINKLNALGAKLVVLDITFQEPRPQEDKALKESIKIADNVVLYKYLKRNQTTLPSLGLLDVEQVIPPLPIFSDYAVGAGTFTLPKFPLYTNYSHLYVDLIDGIEATQPMVALMAYHRNELLLLCQHIKKIWHSNLIDFNFSNLNDILVNKEWQCQLDNENRIDQIQRLSRYFHAITRHPSLIQSMEQFAEGYTGSEMGKNLFTLINAIKKNDKFYINFYGPERTLTTVPLDQLIPEVEDQNDIEVLRRLLNNKVVYVGLSENQQTEQQDVYRTVYTRTTGVDLSGVEISATVFANIANEEGLVFINTQWRIAIIILFFGISLSSLMIMTRIPAAIFQLFLATIYFSIAYNQFVDANFWWPIFLPLAAIFLGNGLGLWFIYSDAQQRQKSSQQALASYLPDQIADKLTQNPDAIANHELVQGVCLMTDIKGYTSVSEQLSPTELHNRLNEYYSLLLDVVKKYDGVVGNIVADSLLVIWRDKMDSNQCLKVLDCARDIARAANVAETHGVGFPTAIAVHCGEFSLGNLGASNAHFEYSPVGDMVNTVSRIEHLNRDLGTQILCSGSVQAIILGDRDGQPQTGGDQNDLRYLGDFKLRNKAEATQIFEVLLEADQRLQATRLLFREALNSIKLSQWAMAQSYFSEYLSLYPEDGPSKYYLQQCKKEMT